MSELNHNLNKGLVIAEILQAHQHLSLPEIIDISGYSKQAVLRCLETYLHRGWLRKRLNDKRYIWFGMPGDNRVNTAEKLAAKAAVVLKSLSDKTGLVVDLALLNENKQLYIADSTRTRANQGVHLYVAGYQPSLVMTALGRAYLLSCDTVLLNEALGSIANVGDLAERQYVKGQHWDQRALAFKEKGYSVRHKEDYIPQLLVESNPSLAIAVAIMSEHGAIGAINLVWDDSDLTLNTVIERHLGDLQSAADQLSALR